MVDLAKSTLVRLKNKARESKRSYQLCLQLFCQEEFLRRLQESNYHKNFVLKGGLFLFSITHFDSRMTNDTDFLINRVPNTQESLKQIVNEIINIDTENDFVTFEIKKVETISTTKKYAGVSISLIAKIANTMTPLIVDFGFGDIIYPSQEKREIPTQLPNFRAPEIYTYSLESTIAEKLDAILDLMSYSSRMKDYYDLYYLAIKFNFNGKILAQAMRKTFENRQRSYQLSQFSDMISFKNNMQMKDKWSKFARKIEINETYEEIIEVIDSFLNLPFSCLIEYKCCNRIWNCTTLTWTDS